MNKVIKGLFATAALASLIGTVQVNAQEVNLEKLTDISAHTEGDTTVYDSLYIFGQNVHKSYITAFDISEAVLNNVKKDPNIYYKAPTGTAESTLVSLNHSNAQIPENFEMVRLIGALDGDHVSQDKSLYTDGYYIGLEDTTYYGTRKSEIFATNKAEQPEVITDELDSTSLTDKLLGFTKEAAYGKDFEAETLDDGTIKLSGIVKRQNVKFNGGTDNVYGHYFAYQIEIPELKDPKFDKTKGYIKLNTKTISLDQFDGVVIFKLTEENKQEPYEITIDLDGDGNEYAPQKIKFDLKDLVLEKDSTAEVLKVPEKLSNDWGFDSSKYTVEEFNCEGTTCTLKGNVVEQAVKGFGTGDAATNGFYFTLGIKVGTDDATTIKIENNANEVQFSKSVAELKALGKYNDYDETTGVLGLIWKTTPNSAERTMKITVDKDGAGEEYAPVTYTVKYTMSFGQKSVANVLPIDDIHRLEHSERFKWVPGNGYHVEFGDLNPETKTIELTGFVPKITDGNIGTSVTSKTGYYIAYTVTAKPQLADNVNVHNELTNLKLTINDKVHSYNSFDNDTMITVLQTLDPENTEVGNRKITIKIDFDGNGTKYAEETYILDWSHLTFGDTASADITSTLGDYKEELKGYGYDPELSSVTLSEPLTGDTTFASKFNLTGSLYEQTIAESLGFAKTDKFFFALVVTPDYITDLHPDKDARLPNDAYIKFTNGVNESGVPQEDVTDTTIDADTLNNKGSEVALFHVRTDENKRILVEIHYGDEYEDVQYLIDYSGVTLKGVTKATVLNVNTTDEGTAGGNLNKWYGYDVTEAGKFDIALIKERDGKDVYKATGYVNSQNLTVGTFGGNDDNAYYLPYSIEISNAQAVKEITVTNDNSGKEIKINATTNQKDFNDIKTNGRYDVLRLVAHNGGTPVSDLTFSVKITYDNAAGVTYDEQTLYFDFSDVKIDALGEFITAYRDTAVKGLTVTDETFIKTGEKNTLDTVIRKKIDWFKVITDETAKSASKCKTQTDGETCIEVVVDHEKIIKEIAKYADGITFDGNLFAQDITFEVKLSAEGLIKSIKGDLVKETNFSGQPKVTYGDGSAVVEELHVNYGITTSDVKENDVVVYTTEENEAALDNLDTTFNNVDQNTDKTKKTVKLSELDEDQFNAVYTKVARVAKTDLTEITINDKLYDNTLRETGVGHNVFLDLPVFYVEDDVLYVSTTELTVAAVKEGSNIVHVVYDGCDYTVTTGLTPADGKLKIKATGDVKLAYEAAGKTHQLEVSTLDETTGRYKVKLTSSHGANAIGIKLTDANGEAITASDFTMYIYDENGVSLDKVKGGEFTIVIYPEYNNGNAYTAEQAGTVTFTKTIYVEGKGSITIDFELVKEANQD